MYYINSDKAAQLMVCINILCANLLINYYYLYVGTLNVNIYMYMYVFKNQFWMTDVVTACIAFI